MILNTNKMQNRRAFIKAGLRNLLLLVFVFIGMVLGLRRFSTDPARRTNLLPCDSCTRYPDCDYGLANYHKQRTQSVNSSDCPILDEDENA